MDRTPSSWIVINVKWNIHLNLYQQEQDLTGSFFFFLSNTLFPMAIGKKKKKKVTIFIVKERIVNANSIMFATCMKCSIVSMRTGVDRL